MLISVNYFSFNNAETKMCVPSAFKRTVPVYVTVWDKLVHFAVYSIKVKQNIDKHINSKQYMSKKSE